MKQDNRTYYIIGALVLIILAVVLIKKKTTPPPAVAVHVPLPPPVSSTPVHHISDEAPLPNMPDNPQEQIPTVSRLESFYDEVVSYLGMGSKKVAKKPTNVTGDSANSAQPASTPPQEGGGGRIGGGPAALSAENRGDSSNPTKEKAPPLKSASAGDDGKKEDDQGGKTTSGLISNTETTPTVDPIKQASLLAQQAFENTSHVDIAFPEELTYMNLDLDDGIAGIQGFNTQLQVNISILAKEGNYTPDQLPAFMQDYGAYIPGYNTAYTDKLSKQEPERPPAQSGSGLNSPYVWSIHDGGKTIIVAMVQRSDGKGTYLAVLNGPSSYFDNNEDRYDAIYSQIRATP